MASPSLQKVGGLVPQSTHITPMCAWFSLVVCGCDLLSQRTLINVSTRSPGELIVGIDNDNRSGDTQTLASRRPEMDCVGRVTDKQDMSECIARPFVCHALIVCVRIRMSK